MLSPTWGVYSGYELFEHVAARPGSEEYLDSEKYQLRPRDWAAADRRRPLAGAVPRRCSTEIRREHPALQQLRNLRFHQVESDEIIAFSKRDDATGDTVLVVVTVNPHEVREGVTVLDLPALGIDWDATFTVRDLLTGAEYQWGERNYVRLDPHAQAAHIFTVPPRRSCAR